jgi:hypothetical protein
MSIVRGEVTFMHRHLVTTIEAGLLVVASTLVYMPEARTFAVRVVFNVLWVVIAGSNLWNLHRSGVLRMSVDKFVQMRSKPKFSLLNAASLLMAVAAMMTMTG